MRRRRRATIEDLRLSIDCLPPATRAAMLDGIRSNEIIVGGYTDGRGGVCPMLAAHRAGGRTNFIHFARTWDRFANAGKRARRATRRELLILTAHLEASLLAEESAIPDLAAAMAEHRELVARRAPSPSDAPCASHDRAGELLSDAEHNRDLRHRPSWAWMRIFRRYDEYERALDRLEPERPEREIERHGLETARPEPQTRELEAV